MPGGAASGQKGSHYERELVTAFREAGWGSLRLPSSGSSTQSDLPDVLVGKPNPVLGRSGGPLSHVLAIEAKSGDATTLYVNRDEVDALAEFAETWGAKPLISGRFTTRMTPTSHYLLEPWNARITDQGNYGIPIDDVEDRAYAIVYPDGYPDGHLQVMGDG